MNITVYTVGSHDYEVVRMTDDTKPEWVYFVVQTGWGRKKLGAWAVNTSKVQGLPRFLHWLRVKFPPTSATVVSGTYSFESYLAQIELSIDEAFNKACRHAESLAGISSETSRIIDEHAVEIRARLMAQQEVEMIAPTSEAG